TPRSMAKLWYCSPGIGLEGCRAISPARMKWNGVVRLDSKNSPSTDGNLHWVQYGISIGDIGVPYLPRPSPSRLSGSHRTRPSGNSEMVAIRAWYSSQEPLRS